MTVEITEPGVYDMTCPLGYGNETGYKWHGCRCTPCRAANTAEAAKHRVRGSHPGGRPADPDIDEIAVERCLNGTYAIRGLNAAERRRLVELGKQRGLNHREIARRVGLTDRTVVRISKKLRESA